MQLSKSPRLLSCSLSAKMKCLSPREDVHPLIKKAEVPPILGISAAPWGYLCGYRISSLGAGGEAFERLHESWGTVVLVLFRGLLSLAGNFPLRHASSVRATISATPRVY